MNSDASDRARYAVVGLGHIAQVAVTRGEVDETTIATLMLWENLVAQFIASQGAEDVCGYPIAGATARVT